MCLLCPRGSKRAIRQAHITYKRHLVGSEKFRRQGQITTRGRRARRQAGGQAEGAGSAELTVPCVGIPGEAAVVVPRKATGP